MRDRRVVLSFSVSLSFSKAISIPISSCVPQTLPLASKRRRRGAAKRWKRSYKISFLYVRRRARWRCRTRARRRRHIARGVLRRLARVVRRVRVQIRSGRLQRPVPFRWVMKPFFDKRGARGRCVLHRRRAWTRRRSQARRKRSGLVVISIHDTRIDRGGPAISSATPFRLLVPWRLVSGGFAYPLFHGRSGGAFFHVVGPLRYRLGSRVADALTRVPGPRRANARSAPTSADLVFSRRRKRWRIFLACG